MAGQDTLDLGAWFIIRMASADTLPVVRALARRGIEAWTPLERKLGRMPRTRRQYDKEFALMPSYAFVAVHDLPAVQRIALLPQGDMAAFSIFHHKGGVPLIADDQLDALRAEEGRLQGIYERACRKGKKLPTFAPGHIVRMDSGGFAGLEGIVEGQEGQFTLVNFDGFHSPIKISSLLLVEDVSGAEADIAAKAA